MLAPPKIFSSVLAACLGIALGACQSAGPAATAPVLNTVPVANEPVAKPEMPDGPQIDVNIRAAIDRMAVFSSRSGKPQDLVKFDKKAVEAMLGVDLEELPPVHGLLKWRFVAPPMDWTPQTYRDRKEGGRFELQVVPPSYPGLLAAYTMPIDPERHCIPMSWFEKHFAVELHRMLVVPLLSMQNRLPGGGDSQQATPSAPEVQNSPGGVFSTSHPYNLITTVSHSGCIVNLEAHAYFKKTQV